MNPPWPGGWRYTLGAIGAWLLFLAALVGVVYGREAGWPQGLLGALACLPAVIALAQFVVAYRLVAKEDEFVRGLFAKRMLTAGALVIVLAIAWSGAEMMGAPHLGAWLIYPLFWGLFGLVTPFVKGSNV